MNWLKTILHEIFGLFVDDASFALAILLWLVLVNVLTPHLGIPTSWSAIILFAGLALILAESTTRYAKPRNQKNSSAK
jgi:membrane protein implicated in regulation of membrane protease activity